MAWSLPDLVRRSADRAGDHPAVRSAGQQWTYAELAARAEDMAMLLLDHGLDRGDRVAIYMRRGFDSMAAINGVMLAGGAYVPLDSAAPPDRLAAVLADCDVHHVVVSPEHRDGLRQVLKSWSQVDLVVGAGPDDGLPVALAVPWPAVDGYRSGAPIDVRVIEDDLALIFYTSGTTGKPKGVAHRHRSMLANVEWALDEFGIDAADRVPHLTSHHFDLSWFEMYATPAAGATMVIVPETHLRFPPDLAELVAAERVTTWCSVPSVLVSLVQRGDLAERDLGALRLVLFAGERFPAKHLRSLMAAMPHPRYVNMYGTTETHIAAFWPVPTLDSDEPLPIGQACRHVNLGIVTPDGTMATGDETGELVIRGPSLMDGYWNLPERTTQALRPETFAPRCQTVAYHTGDLVRRRPDGAIEIIGRGDRRVKIRGNLVDLDEVEAVLLAHDGVAEAAAYLVDDDTAPARIESGVRRKPGCTVTGPQLRIHVARLLPPPAVPDVVEILDDLPRTGSGKMARAELRSLIAERTAARRGAASAIPAASVNEILRAVLVDEFGRDPAAAAEQDLVASGAIDSITIVRLVAEIEQRWGVSVPNTEFVVTNFSSLETMSALVERLTNDGGRTDAEPHRS